MGRVPGGTEGCCSSEWDYEAQGTSYVYEEHLGGRKLRVGYAGGHNASRWV